MRRWTAPLVLVVALVAAQTATAQSYRNYFPLQQGNTWTHQHGSSEAETYLSVSDSFYGIYQVSGIPGAQSGLWVTWGGNTLYAWRPSTQAWVPFIKFGVDAGTSWRVTLDYPFWDNAELQLKVKGFDAYDPYLDRTYANSFHFYVLSDVGNGGPKEMVFAPNVGMIQYSNWVDEAYDPWFLTQGRLGGRRYGLIKKQTLESGSYSRYPNTRRNQVLLINSQSAWTRFYAQHNPGQPTPRVDFNRQTVVAVLAGERATGGYTIEVPRVTWMYPYSTARVSVVETTPAGPVIQMTTKPYTLVMLEEKVYRATVDWQVVYNR